MTDMLMEAVRMVGAGVLLLMLGMVAYAVLLGTWRAVSGSAKRQAEAVSTAWIAGWNAAMRGQDADQDEWVKRYMGVEFEGFPEDRL